MRANDKPEPVFCNCLALRRATRAITKAYDRALAPVGLRATQFSLLATLAGTGPLALGPLARAMGMDRATLGHNLRPLQAQGLVGLNPGADRRTRILALSDAGRDLLARALPLWQGAQAAFEAGFGTEDAAALRTALARVAPAAGQARSIGSSAPALSSA